METAAIEQANIRNTNRSLTKVAFILAILSQALTRIGIFPWYPGHVHTAASLVNSLLSFIFPTTRVSLNFAGVCLAIAPIWVLILDPCALPFAQMLSMVSIMCTCIEHRNPSMKAFYTALMLLS